MFIKHKKHVQHEEPVEVPAPFVPVDEPLAVTETKAPAPVEEGPPFYATEYMFKADSGNVKCVYTLVGEPAPTAPDRYTFLNGVIAKFPFQSIADRATAIG